jgi:hypothetical protein
MKPTPAVSAAETLAHFMELVAGLRLRDGELLKQQIALEKGGGDFRATAKPDAWATAHELLNGFATAPRAVAGASWSEITFERERIQHALHLAGQREVQLRAAAVADLMRELAPEYEAALIETARALIALRRANARRAALRERLDSVSGGGVGFRCDRSDGLLFAPQGAVDKAYDWLQAVAAAGFLTQKEVDNA